MIQSPYGWNISSESEVVIQLSDPNETRVLDCHKLSSCQHMKIEKSNDRKFCMNLDLAICGEYQTQLAMLCTKSSSGLTRKLSSFDRNSN